MAILAEFVRLLRFFSLLLDNVVSIHHRSDVAKVPNWTRGHLKFRREAKKYESLRKFWAAVGVEPGAGSRIYRGLLTPGRKVACVIEESTSRRIVPRDWEVPAEAP